MSHLPKVDNLVVIIYLFSFTGGNWSMRNVTTPLKKLSLYGFKNLCLRTLFFFSTPLFVLTEFSSSSCQNPRTYSLKASQLCKVTIAKTSNSIYRYTVL